MTGETKRSESGWTVDTLAAHYDALRDGDLLFQAERDKRYEQRFDAQEDAVKKAQAVIDVRLNGMNEWRQTITDQTATYMPRSEAEQRTAANAKDIVAIASRMDRIEAKGVGRGDMWGWIVGGVAVGVTILGYLQNH